MKKYTIYAAGIHGAEAFNMTFVLFDNFTITRAYGISVGEAKKFVIVTIFTNESNESKVTDLRDKFTAMADPATAIKEDITVL
jgi:hypothetical protein